MEWRNLCEEELHDFYFTNTVKVIKFRMMGGSARIQDRNVFRILNGKSIGKIPLGRPRCRWEDNIKMDPAEVRIEGMPWFPFAKYRNQLRIFVNEA